MDKFEKWRTEQLANFGFSHKYIASLVFQIPIDKITEKQYRQVANYLLRNSIKLTDFRNGKTQQSIIMTTKLLRKKTKI